MRLLQLSLLLTALVTGTPVSATDPAPAPSSSGVDETRPFRPSPREVKCLPTINVWTEPDVSKIPQHELYGTDGRRRVPLSLQTSAPYRGDSVMCSYATRGRDVTATYSLRCRMPRRNRTHRHAYHCN